MADYRDYQQFNPGGLCCGVYSCEDFRECMGVSLGTDPDGVPGRNAVVTGLPTSYDANDTSQWAPMPDWDCGDGCSGLPSSMIAYPWNIGDSQCLMQYITAAPDDQPELCSDQATWGGVPQTLMVAVTITQFVAQSNGLSTCTVRVGHLDFSVLRWSASGVLAKDICNRRTITVPFSARTNQGAANGSTPSSYACVDNRTTTPSVYVTWP